MPKIKHVLQPARRVIDSFGGCRALARVLSVNPSTVSRWTTASDRRGTNGRIPQKYWSSLISAAHQQGFTLGPHDLSGM